MPGLEAVARAQRGVEEHHEQRAARQDVAVVAAHRGVELQREAGLEHGLDLLPSEVTQRDEVTALESLGDHESLLSSGSSSRRQCRNLRQRHERHGSGRQQHDDQSTAVCARSPGLGSVQTHRMRPMQVSRRIAHSWPPGLALLSNQRRRSTWDRRQRPATSRFRRKLFSVRWQRTSFCCIALEQIASRSIAVREIVDHPTHGLRADCEAIYYT